MNVFTTEHPLDSLTGRSMSRKSKAGSYLVGALLVAIFILPFLIGFDQYLNLTDINTTDYVPDPFWVVVVGAMIESLVVAFVCLPFYWLSTWLFRRFRKALVIR